MSRSERDPTALGTHALYEEMAFGIVAAGNLPEMHCWMHTFQHERGVVGTRFAPGCLN